MARGGGFPRGGRMGGGSGGGMGNMQQMIAQAQKMQENMEKTKAELELHEVSASAGGGMVTAVVNGKYELKTLELKPDIVDPDDVDMLQDMVIAAVNEAMRAMKTYEEQEMGKVTGGLNLGL